MKAKFILSIGLRAVLWIPLVFFSCLLTHNAVLYFTHGGEYGILPEKFIARQDLLWNICFYTHLPAGIICLLVPIFLFARRLFKQLHKFHVLVGNIYVWITLAIVCPSGIYLALYVKGGFITQVGFVIQGVLLAWYTWRGYKATVEKNKTLHVQCMIRSYAVATVVLSFRIYHILFFLWKVPYMENYAISQWLGLSGNLLIAEIVVMLMSIKIKSSYNLKSENYETI